MEFLILYTIFAVILLVCMLASNSKVNKEELDARYNALDEENKFF